MRYSSKIIKRINEIPDCRVPVSSRRFGRLHLSWSLADLQLFILYIVYLVTSSLDSIRIGLFLRRYPVARLFVILYMVSACIEHEDKDLLKKYRYLFRDFMKGSSQHRRRKYLHPFRVFIKSGLGTFLMQQPVLRCSCSHYQLLISIPAYTIMQACK